MAEQELHNGLGQGVDQHAMNFVQSSCVFLGQSSFTLRDSRLVQVYDKILNLQSGLWWLTESKVDGLRYVD